jgi:hypothetical protein
MTTFPVSGGCHCGAVRYTLHAPAISVQHCHCSMCRTISGSLSETGAVVERTHLSVDRGADNLTTYRSSPSFRRLFCRTCGCQLFAYEDSEPVLMYFGPATLDGGAHPGHPPDKEYHIQFASRAEWDPTDDDLAKYDSTGPDEILTQIQKG